MMKINYILLLLFIVFSAGCSDLPDTVETLGRTDADIPPNNSTFKIATFNMKVFGDAKVSDPMAFEILTIVACEFDIMAVQEIRDIDGSSIIEYVENINNVCEEKYSYIVSPRLGRSTSKEQYAFIYKSDEVSVLQQFIYQDGNDNFEREPYIAEFNRDGYNFFLVNIHVKPDDAKQEIHHLINFVPWSIPSVNDRNNLIILGDLNADCTYYNPKTEESRKFYHWVIPDDADTTTGSTDCAYDRIIMAESSFQHYSDWGIFKFDEVVEVADVSAVSDHYPVWVELK